LNNLDKINLFLDDRKNTTMLLPKVGAEVVIFYQLLIQQILKSKNYLCKKIDNYQNINELIAPSLFEEKRAYIIDIAMTKSVLEDLSGVQDKSQKFFIFINYSSYKKNSLQSIQLNAYDYKKDISSFVLKDQNFQSLRNEIKTDILNFSYHNPHLLFSEFQKLEVHTGPFEMVKDHEKDTILSVRKEIFKYKNEFSIKVLSRLYGLLKREVKIKKFNF
jgi:hypothetical protein